MLCMTSAQLCLPLNSRQCLSACVPLLVLQIEELKQCSAMLFLPGFRADNSWPFKEPHLHLDASGILAGAVCPCFSSL